MEYTFDPSKDDANRGKHGLPLSFGAGIFEDANHLLIPSMRMRDGEERFKVVGMVDGKIFTCVSTRRGDVARFISVRRSNRNEERANRSSC